MFVSKAEYTVKPGFAQQNLTNIKAFLPEALGRLKPGSTYSVSVSEDGLSFLHVFMHSAQQDVMILSEIPAFMHFLDEVMAGCVAPPSMTTYSEI
jgi:hypothetical protein